MDFFPPDSASATPSQRIHTPSVTAETSASRHAIHLVRVGAMARIGRFWSYDGRSYARHTRVVCRTSRGLEVGEVLGPAEPNVGQAQCDGTLVRGMTAEDELFVARLHKNREDAFRECEKLLCAEGCDAALMEVEQLFDGQSIYFYFLGPVSAQVERLTQQLAEAYESQAKFGAFLDAVEQGCGPGCGTDDAAGCGTGCSSCELANACKGRAGDSA